MKKIWWQNKFRITNISISIFLPKFSGKVFQYIIILYSPHQNMINMDFKVFLSF